MWPLPDDSGHNNLIRVIIEVFSEYLNFLYRSVTFPKIPLLSITLNLAFYQHSGTLLTDNEKVLTSLSVNSSLRRYLYPGPAWRFQTHVTWESRRPGKPGVVSSPEASVTSPPQPAHQYRLISINYLSVSLFKTHWGVKAENRLNNQTGKKLDLEEVSNSAIS